MYIYETHLHTSESSKCGSTSGAFYPEYYKALGYDGIFITDHFFNGNCAISITNDWDKMVNDFCLGYECAKKAGDQIGLKVFFGWEANFDGDEFLIYGLDKKWLLEHDDILSYSRTKQYEIIHADGGLVVQAHPFRERFYLSKIYLNPENCDAMEAYNTFNEPNQNHNAEIYCKENGFFMTAGSDFHKIGSLETRHHYGMEFDAPLTCEADYVNAILSHHGNMHVPISDRNAGAEIKTELPIIINHRE